MQSTRVFQNAFFNPIENRQKMLGLFQETLFHHRFQLISVFGPPIAEDLHLVTQAEVLHAKVDVVLGILWLLNLASGLHAVFQGHPDAVPFSFFALPDGSWIYQDDEELTLLGEAYLIRNGVIQLLTRDGETLDLSRL